MGFSDKILASIISMSLLTGVPKGTVIRNESFMSESEFVDNSASENVNTSETSNMLTIQKRSQKKIFICLTTDSKTSFTHRNVLEQVSDPQSTILEYPIAQLFQKYGNRPHPLVVSGVKNNFRALLGKNGIERLNSKIPQKLVPRTEKITSNTKYQIGDTIRFSLIDPLLKDDFPRYISDQLKEDGFKSFSNSDAKIFDTTVPKKVNFQNFNNKKSDFIYDIVVKKVPSGRSALAVYRNGEFFMATYVSIGTTDHKTQTGQFKLLNRDPYKRSFKYENSPMPNALRFYGSFYFHQGNVSGYPLSHGCVRLPGVYADILYSLIKDLNSTDVFISKDLYKIKK